MGLQSNKFPGSEDLHLLCFEAVGNGSNACHIVFFQNSIDYRII